jgi:hypothetical protein
MIEVDAACTDLGTAFGQYHGYFVQPEPRTGRPDWPLECPIFCGSGREAERADQKASSVRDKSSCLPCGGMSRRKSKILLMAAPTISTGHNNTV